MAETPEQARSDWGDDAEAAPRRKKGVPTWVWWGCGGGCLLVSVVGIVLLVFIGSVAKNALDPEKAWPEVQEVLPFDQRPEGWDARGTSLLGVGQYFLTPPGPEEKMVLVMRFRNAAELDAMLDPKARQNKGLFGVGEIDAAEQGTLELQGREVPCLRFRAWVPEVAQGDEEKQGASMRIDLTGQGSVPVLLQVFLFGEEERVSDEAVQELLAPFDVWRGR